MGYAAYASNLDDMHAVAWLGVPCLTLDAQPASTGRSHGILLLRRLFEWVSVQQPCAVSS